MPRRRKTVTISRADAAHYISKAGQFAAESTAALAAGRHDAALLNAIHAAISAADAICVALAGQRSADPDHQRAVDLLEEVVGSGAEAKRHLRQLRQLLAKKNAVEYESRPATARVARDGEVQARRVLAWATKLVRG